MLEVKRKDHDKWNVINLFSRSYTGDSGLLLVVKHVECESMTSITALERTRASTPQQIHDIMRRHIPHELDQHQDVPFDRNSTKNFAHFENNFQLKSFGM